MIREQASFSILTCLALFAVSALPLPIVLFSLFHAFLLTLLSLFLIQAWADAFRSSPDLTGVVQIYEELKRKGIEFPMSDLETLSPIHTPQRVYEASRMCTHVCEERLSLAFPGNLSHSVTYFISAASRQRLPQRATPPYISTAPPLLSPHHKLSHRPTPLLRSPTFMPLDPSILHLIRYDVTPITQ